VKIKRYKLLNYVLITLLIFAPVRSVTAMQLMHCDMDASAMKISATVSTSNVSSADIHASHNMSSMPAHDSSHQQSEKNQHPCCSGAKICVSDCEMGTSVSLLMQTSNYAPLFINVAETEIISSEPIVRELTPLSRPPVKIS